MNVSHYSGKYAIYKNVDHPVAFILVNRRKDFATFYATPQTRYEGFFVEHNGLFIKTISRIERQSVADSLELYHNTAAAFSSGKSSEIYSIISDEPVLAYENLTNEPVVIRLDMRDQFHIPQWGRNYNLEKDGEIAVVRYSDDCLPTPVFLATLHDGEFYAQEEWVPVEYARDRLRNSEPATVYEYSLGKFTGTKLIIAFGETYQKAIERALRYKLVSQAQAVIEWRAKPKRKCEKIDAAARRRAREYTKDALDLLFIENKMLAGMPWFTKSWVRDELLSLPALPRANARALLAKYLDADWHDGRLPVIFGGSNCCSDGVGLLAWAILFARFTLDEKEKQVLATKLVKAVDALGSTQNEFGFIPSGKQESWMDSIERTGYPVETQALYSKILYLTYILTGNERYERKYSNLLKSIRSHYFVDGYLHDRLHDSTIRPNLFLASLFEPKILTASEWETCFDKVLPHLWLNWGGLASVDSQHECFCDVSTGECDTSYHNGDSWFFVNNLAALVLYNTNATKYAVYINAIHDASTEEILWHNYVGCPGEISSARALESWGCGLQGFSAAAYLYLAHHLPIRKRGLKNLFCTPYSGTSLPPLRAAAKQYLLSLEP